jgi:hypothetical protein
MGNITSNFAPPEIPSETRIFPISFDEFFASGKPMPVPSGLVVKRIENSFSAFRGMPSRYLQWKY